MASSAASGASAIEGLASERLFFKKELPFFASSLTLLSTQLVGYGLAGFLRPLLVYPARITFPGVLPCAALFRSMSRQTTKTRAQLSFFKKAFLGISIYEILPTYIAPALQALSPWCLTLPQVNAVTNLFGGSVTGEGMGFLAVSADWMLVGHHGPMFVPLASQITEWAGYLLGIFLCMAAFRHNWFESRGLPFISYNMFDGTGKTYNLTEAIHENGTANVKGIARLGLPYYPATMVLSKALLCMAVSSSVSVALFHSFVPIKKQRKIDRPEAPQENICPHRAVTEHLPDFPMFGYVLVFLLSVVLAVIAMQFGHSGLSVLGLFTALSLASVLCLALGYFEGTIGLTLRITPVVQMLGGIAFPGNVHENLWFTLYGSATVSQCTLMLKDLKLGQYMHLAPRAVVIAQLGGTLLGAIVHYLVMVTILHFQSETLLLPHGSTWTGMNLSKMASEATSWGIFSRELYFHGKRYAIVPYFVIFGLVVPIPFLILQRLRPASRLSLFNPSLMISGMAHSMLGATSGRTMAALVGFTSQYVMRKYHFTWYKKYNYVLCAALDGGTQLAVLLIGFILQGGAGLDVKFPTYALNPEGPKDYCYMPDASGGGHKGHHGGHTSHRGVQQSE